MTVIYVLSVIIGIVVSVLLAFQFSSAAEQKGYGESRYFWLCLLLGLPGWLLVCALPDKSRDEDMARLESELHSLTDELRASRIGSPERSGGARTLPHTQSPAAPRAVPLSSAQSQSVRAPAPSASNPSQATDAAPLGENGAVRPTPGTAPGTIVCPRCGEVQREGRSRCWSCGVMFE